MPTTIVVKVSQGIDDGFRWIELENGVPYTHYIYRYGVCYDVGKHWDWYSKRQLIADSWWLFRNVPIPQGVHILDAKLRFTCSAPTKGSVCNTVFRAEAVDNAETPIQGDYKEGWDDYENRLKTVSGALWHDVPPWSEGARYETPPECNLASVIQEIVNRLGWKSGNGIQIFWMDDGSSEGVEKARRSAAGYEYPLAPGTGQYAVELEVTYETAVPKGMLEVHAYVT